MYFGRLDMYFGCLDLQILCMDLYFECLDLYFCVWACILYINIGLLLAQSVLWALETADVLWLLNFIVGNTASAELRFQYCTVWIISQETSDIYIYIYIYISPPGTHFGAPGKYSFFLHTHFLVLSNSLELDKTAFSAKLCIFLENTRNPYKWLNLGKFS